MRFLPILVFAIAILVSNPAVSAQTAPAEEVGAKMAKLEERVRELEVLVADLRGELMKRHQTETTQATTSDRSATAGTAASQAQTKPVVAAAKPDPGALKTYWKDGLRFDSADKSFQLKLGGRLHNDWAIFSGASNVENRVGNLLDGVEFRRARLYGSGVIFGNVEYKAEFDFAGGDSQLRDAYIGLQDVPGLGSLKVGHVKEPFGLEQLTSSNYTTFLERSVSDVFSPSRNTGVLVQNTLAADRVNWAAGVFRETNNSGLARADGGYNFTGRLTGLPWYGDGGRKLLHLGVAYSRQDSLADSIRYRQRPEAHLAPQFTDTGNLAAGSTDLLGLEAAWVDGPFSLQGEYVRAFVNTPTPDDPSFFGFYLTGSWFLTGESRQYKTSSGAFDRNHPRAPFGREGGGKGAWEIAARYSHLDLNDAGVRGGRLNDFTLGLNWYLNPNARVMWNYVFSDLDSADGAHILQTRVQVDF